MHDPSRPHPGDPPRGTRPTRALGYARVSSAHQAQGSSLEDQQAAIRAYAEARGVAVAALYVEAESAVRERIEHRAEMQRLMRDVRRGDLVLVSVLDRWSRDPEYTYTSIRHLTERGASFYAIGDACDPSTPEGDTMLNFRVLFAKEEHKRIRRRLVGTRALLRDRGLYVDGPPPFGYRRGPKGPTKNVLVIEPEEAALVRRAFRLCVAGRSIREIAAATGRERSLVAKLLLQRVYTGEIKNSRGEWIKGAHPALVSADDFARAADGRHDRLGSGPGPREGTIRTAGWILRDVARCARCGAVMAAAWADDRNYYRCARRCSPYVHVEPVEALAAALVLARLEELRAELAFTPPEGTASAVVDVGPARARLVLRRERLADAYADGAITRDQMRERLARVDADLVRLDEAARMPQDERPRRERLASVEGLRDAWRRADGAGRRAVVRSLARAVRIGAGREPVAVWRGADELGEEE